jgi:putative FmdB family regulatory protein
MTYDYKCACGHKFEAFNFVADRHRVQCPKCGGEARMLFSPPVAMHIFQPYWDEHIGKDGPVYLESHRQKNRMLREQGLEQL